MEKESQLGAVLGPFRENPFTCPPVLSPLNTTEKKASRERRVILDLSFPAGSAVNEAIDGDTYLGQTMDLKYPGVDELIELIHRVMVQGAFCISET